MRLRDRFVKVCGFLDWLVIGSVISLIKANRSVRRKAATDDTLNYMNDRRLRSAEVLREKEYLWSLERIHNIEEKASKSAIGIGLALVVFGAATPLLARNGPVVNEGLRVAVAVIALSGISHLLASGFLALLAYKVARVFRPSLEAMIPIVSPQYAGAEMLLCMEQNYRAATIKTNFLSASFGLLYRAILMIAILACLVIVGSALQQAPELDGSGMKMYDRCAGPDWPAQCKGSVRFPGQEGAGTGGVAPETSPNHFWGLGSSLSACPESTGTAYGSTSTAESNRSDFGHPASHGRRRQTRYECQNGAIWGDR